MHVFVSSLHMSFVHLLLSLQPLLVLQVVFKGSRHLFKEQVKLPVQLQSVQHIFGVSCGSQIKFPHVKFMVILKIVLEVPKTSAIDIETPLTVFVSPFFILSLEPSTSNKTLVSFEMLTTLMFFPSRKILELLFISYSLLYIDPSTIVAPSKIIKNIVKTQ